VNEVTAKPIQALLNWKRKKGRNYDICRSMWKNCNSSFKPILAFEQNI